MPPTYQFAVVSLILYYDVGLVLEILGYPYSSEFFGSLLDAGATVQIGGLLAIAAAPWLFRAGATVITRGLPYQAQEPASGIAKRRRFWFYLLTLSIVVPLAVYGVSSWSPAEGLWATRVRVGINLGALVVILYVPLHILAFYVRQSDSRKIFGRVYSLLLVAATGV